MRGAPRAVVRAVSGDTAPGRTPGAPGLRVVVLSIAGFLLTEILLTFTTIPAAARHCASITFFTALCWSLEVIPLGAASLIPLALFPLFGVLPATTVAFTYFDDINFLFLGGMVLGAALERWNLHRRIALSVVKRIGTSPRGIILGFLLGTAFLSMWISNTATAVMMYPIARAVIETASIQTTDRGETSFAAGLLLAVAYGANMGGIGTPIGTGPNFAFFGQFYSSGTASAPLAGFNPPAFPVWIAAMAPILLISCLAGWWTVTRLTGRVPAAIPRLREAFSNATTLGPWTRPEARIAVLFGIAVLLWVFRSLPIGGRELGWIQLFPESLFTDVRREEAITSSTVAVGFAILAFFIPAGDGRGSRLVDASAIRAMPWDMLLLLGGGFAIAKAFSVSGLSASLARALGEQTSELHGGVGGVWIICLLLSVFVTFLSEVTSNTATALVMLPIAAGLGHACGVDPRLPALSVTLASSLAFMLPIGTPPNAIVFSSGRIPMGHMLRSGFLLNLVCIVVSTVFLFLWVAPLLGIPTGGKL